MSSAEYLLGARNPELSAIETEIDQLLEDVNPGEVKLLAFSDFCTIKTLEDKIISYNNTDIERQEALEAELVRMLDEDDPDQYIVDGIAHIMRLVTTSISDSDYFLTNQRLAIAIERHNDRKVQVLGYASSYLKTEQQVFELAERYNQVTGSNEGEDRVIYRMQVALNFFFNSVPEDTDQDSEL